MRVERLFVFSGALGSAIALHEGAYRTATAFALVSAVALCSIKESSHQQTKRVGRKRSESAPPRLSEPTTAQPLFSIEQIPVLESKIERSPPVEKAKARERPMPPLRARSRSFKERLLLLAGRIPVSKVPEIVDGVYDLRACPDYRLDWQALFGDQTLCFEMGDLDGIEDRSPKVALTGNYHEAHAIRGRCPSTMVILFPQYMHTTPYFDPGRLGQVQVRLLNSVPLYSKGHKVEMYETQSSFSLSTAGSLQRGLKEGGELRLIFKQENSPFIDAFKRKFTLAAKDDGWGFSAEPREEERGQDRHLVYIRQAEEAKS